MCCGVFFDGVSFFSDSPSALDSPFMIRSLASSSLRRSAALSTCLATFFFFLGVVAFFFNPLPMVALASRVVEAGVDSSVMIERVEDYMCWLLTGLREVGWWRGKRVRQGKLGPYDTIASYTPSHPTHRIPLCPPQTPKLLLTTNEKKKVGGKAGGRDLEMTMR